MGKENRPTYESPQILRLGSQLQGSGANCKGGSSANNNCNDGAAASPNCLNGGNTGSLSTNTSRTRK